MRRCLRISAWAAGVALGVLALLCATLLVAGNTAGGRHLIEQLTSRLTHGQVQIAGLAGTFPTAIQLRRFQIRDERGVWLTGEQIALRWSPVALLRRHIRVDSLRVRRLDIERAPVSHPSRSTGPTRWPRIDLHQAEIDALELGPSLTGQRTLLSVQGTAHLASLEDARADVIARRTGGTGQYEIRLASNRRRVDATVRVDEPAGGPLEHLAQLPGLGALSVVARFNGPRNAVRLDLIAQAGTLDARAQGSVDLVRRSADLTYSAQGGPERPRADLAWKRLDLQGSAHGAWTAPVAQGHLQVSQLQLPGSAAVADLTADLSGDSGLLRLQAQASGLLIPGPRPRLLASSPVTLNATMRLDQARRPATLLAHHPLFDVQASGFTAGHPTLTFRLKLTDLTTLAQLGGPHVQGSAVLDGDLTHPGAQTRLALNGRADLTGGEPDWSHLVGPQAQLQLLATLSDQSLEVQRLRLNGRSATLAASGTVLRASPGTAGGPWSSLRVQGSLGLANLAALSPRLAGRADATYRIEGPLRSLSAQVDAKSALSVGGSPAGTIQASVEAHGLPASPRATLEARGSLDGAPLKVNASLQRAGTQAFHVVIRTADWKSAHAQGDLLADARIERARGSLALRIDRLEDLDRLVGTPLQGRVTGSVALLTDGYRPQARLQLHAQDVVVAGVHGSGQLTGSGPISALPLELALQLPEAHGAPASLSATAVLRLPQQALDLKSAQITLEGEPIHLLSASRLSFAQGFSISDLKLGARQAVLEVQGRVLPTLDLRASLNHVDAPLINRFAPDLLSQGEGAADAELHGSLKNPTGHAQVKITGVRLAHETARDLPALEARGTAQLRGDMTAALDAELSAGSASQLTLRGHAPLTAAGALDLALTGKLDLALANPLLEAQGRHAAGGLDIQARVAGKPAAPEITGTVQLARGDLRDYNQGLHISDIQGRLVGSHGALAISSLTGRAASGTVSVTGTISVLEPRMPVDLHVTAQNAQPIASDILTANLDADITVKGTLRDQVDVAGTIHVHRADIGIPNSLPPNVAVLDVRRPGQAAPAPTAHRLAIHLDLSLDAPRQILVKGRGLDAELGGNLRIRGTADKPEVSGGFDLIRGNFSLASTPLTFTTGRVAFNGAGLKSRLDPSLDFTAQTSVADTTAILRITGLADSPKFQLSSTPQELPQDEILARLLFGQSASQLTAGQIVQIGAALSTLTGAGSGLNPLVALQKTLGLDRLTVTSATAEKTQTASTQNTGATLEAGRYVASNVFVAARQSTTGVTQLVVDVDLTRQLKVQTRLGNGSTTAQGVTPENDPGSSIGISYQFEY